MNTVKSIVFHGNKQVSYEDFKWEDRPLGPDEIEGPTMATLVSPGTELNAPYIREGDPRLGGYSAVMKIERIGQNVTTHKIGDLVFMLGAHRAYQRVKADDAVCLPAGLSPQTATFARLAGVSWSTLTTTRARPADRVAVFGLGIIGNLASQVFAAAGYRITAFDPDLSRRQIAASHGIADTYDKPDSCDSLHGKFGLALDCAGIEQVVLDCCRIVRKGGEVVIIGVPWKRRCEMQAHEIIHSVFHNYVNLCSGWEWEIPLQRQDFRTGSIMENYAAAMQWLVDGRLKVDGMATAMSPADASDAYARLSTGRMPTLTVVFDWTMV